MTVYNRGMGDLVRKPEALLRQEDRELLDSLYVEASDVHTRHSSFQIENFVLRHREFPSPADRYHQCGMELAVRVGAVVELVYRGRMSAARAEQARLWLGILGWFRWFPFAEISRDRWAAEASYHGAQVHWISNDMGEYFREMRVFLALRRRARSEAETAGVTLNWDQNERDRWVERILSDDKLRKHVAETVSPTFVEELLRHGLPRMERKGDVEEAVRELLDHGTRPFRPGLMGGGPGDAPQMGTPPPEPPTQNPPPEAP